MWRLTIAGECHLGVTADEVFIHQMSLAGHANNKPKLQAMTAENEKRHQK